MSAPARPSLAVTAGKTMGKPSRTLPPGLNRLNKAIFSCRVEAAVYARCCTDTLPAIKHKQCQHEFLLLSKCIQRAMAATGK